MEKINFTNGKAPALNGTNLNQLQDNIEEAINSLKLAMNPVGTVKITIENVNPSTYLGGTWEQIAEGRTLIGAGTGTDANSISQTFEAGATGGEYTHTLTLDEMPDHAHKLFVQADVSGSESGFTQSALSWNKEHDGWANSTFGVTGHQENTLAHNNIQPYLVVYIWKRTA